MRYSMFNAQLTRMWYRSANWLEGINLNITVNTREYFRLTYFWASLCKTKISASILKKTLFSQPPYSEGRNEEILEF
jgi:hypothetical protein